jgi:hypothetical protein
MWLRAFHPDVLVAAIPNGGFRRASEAIKLKSEGVVAGMPDLMILEPSRAFCGLFIEMKTEDGIVSQEQKNIHAQLSVRGYAVHTCRSYESAKKIVLEYLGEKK